MLGGQDTLSLLNLTTQFLDSTVALPDIDSLLLLVQFDEVVHHTLIKVLASQMGVPISGQNLKYTIINGQQGDIEGTTSQVKHQNVLLSLTFVKAIGNSSSSSVI